MQIFENIEILKQNFANIIFFFLFGNKFWNMVFVADIISYTILFMHSIHLKMKSYFIMDSFAY